MGIQKYYWSSKFCSIVSVSDEAYNSNPGLDYYYDVDEVDEVLGTLYTLYKEACKDSNCSTDKWHKVLNEED